MVIYLDEKGGGNGWWCYVLLVPSPAFDVSCFKGFDYTCVHSKGISLLQLS